MDDERHVDPWAAAFPRLTSEGRTRELKDAIRRAEVIYLRSAKLLRDHGSLDRARRAERFAALDRLRLENPGGARRLRGAAERVNLVSSLAPLLETALEGAVDRLHADFGSIQLVDPSTRTLKLVAGANFGTEFLEYFAVVGDDGSACGRAVKEGRQTAIADVMTDDAFAPHVAASA